jgi:hypothetical protein
MNDTQNIAIVYSAHGKKYTKYAERCARYSKKIICDQKCDLVFHTNHDYDNSEGIFDKVVYEKNIFPSHKSHAFKIQGIINLLCNTTYKKFLYIDSDAIILKKDFMIPFDYLDTHDLLGVSAKKEYGPSSKEIDSIGKYVKIPNSFGEINTGVIYYNNNADIIRLMKNWLDFFLNNYKKKYDQGGFRLCLYESDIKFKRIDDIFNQRFKKPNNETVILHGPGSVFKLIDSCS